MWRGGPVIKITHQKQAGRARSPLAVHPTAPGGIVVQAQLLVGGGVVQQRAMVLLDFGQPGLQAGLTGAQHVFKRSKPGVIFHERQGGGAAGFGSGYGFGSRCCFGGGSSFGRGSFGHDGFGHSGFSNSLGRGSFGSRSSFRSS